FTLTERRGKAKSAKEAGTGRPSGYAVACREPPAAVVCDGHAGRLSLFMSGMVFSSLRLRAALAALDGIVADLVPRKEIDLVDQHVVHEFGADPFVDRVTDILAERVQVQG